MSGLVAARVARVQHWYAVFTFTMDNRLKYGIHRSDGTWLALHG